MHSLERVHIISVATKCWSIRYHGSVFLCFVGSLCISWFTGNHDQTSTAERQRFERLMSGQCKSTILFSLFIVYCSLVADRRKLSLQQYKCTVVRYTFHVFISSSKVCFLYVYCASFNSLKVLGHLGVR